MFSSTVTQSLIHLSFLYFTTSGWATLESSILAVHEICRGYSDLLSTVIEISDSTQGQKNMDSSMTDPLGIFNLLIAQASVHINRHIRESAFDFIRILCSQISRRDGVSDSAHSTAHTVRERPSHCGRTDESRIAELDRRVQERVEEILSGVDTIAPLAHWADSASRGKPARTALARHIVDTEFSWLKLYKKKDNTDSRWVRPASIEITRERLGLIKRMPSTEEPTPENENIPRLPPKTAPSTPPEK